MVEPLRVFVGYDERQLINCNVAQSSIARRATRPVAIHPLILKTLPITKQGLTPFTYSRFLVPRLCGFQGWAAFFDGDVILTRDVAELFERRDSQFAVQFVDTEPKYERSAVMLFNCGHPENAILTPDFVQNTQAPLHICGWTKATGYLPPEWQFLVGYQRKPSPDYLPACIHYTGGTPAYEEQAGCDYATEWAIEYHAMNSSRPWLELMGHSAHVAYINGRPVPRWKADETRRAEVAGVAAE